MFDLEVDPMAPSVVSGIRHAHQVARWPACIRQATDRASWSGLVVDGRVGGVLPHGLDAVRRTGLRLVRLAGRDHFAVAGLEAEAELARAVLVELELARHGQ